MTRERALTTSFVTYLRRVVGKTDEDRMVLVEDDDRILSPEVCIALVIGDRSSSEMHGIGLRSGLACRFSNWDVTTPSELRGLHIALFDHFDPSSVPVVPASFDVLALVTTYNEADIIEQLINRLRRDEIRVHVIDNWSNDGTVELLERLANKGDITFERFPKDGPSGAFELEKLLGRVEDIANASGAHWIIHHDADEIRESPWPEVSLRSALFAVEQWGYNCVDHTIVEFRPTDDSWSAGADLMNSFPYFEFGDSPAHFTQLKAWKTQRTRVKMASSGGHDAQFDGRKVFPYKFVTRHYPIRSQAHGERKILRERHSRFSQAEREKGWHAHYDHFDEGSSFLWDRAGLARFDPIDGRFLLERLGGVGLPGNPWPGEATDTAWLDGPFGEGAYRADLEVSREAGPDGRDLSRWKPSEEREVLVSVGNDGDEVWLLKGRNNVGVSSKWFAGSPSDLSRAPLEEGARARFPANIHPGAMGEVRLLVRAPLEPGRYTLLFDLVHEHVRWFGCGVTLSVEVTKT
jgi:glycosyltransferase involved in cell wall biosynthesis